MPYGYAGHCYETTGEALETFQKSFPVMGDTVWVWHTSSSISASGLITYSLISKPTTTNTTATRMASPAGQSPRPGLNNAPAPVVQSSPSSVEGQIDRSEVDQIAFRVSPKDAGKVKTLLVQLDTPSGEVLLKAAVYEVGFDKREGSAVQIAATTPEIRQDTIELTLQQELSNFVVTKTGVNGSPTLIKRSVNTKLGLSPGEVVVLAGLQDDQADESTNRLPFLGWLLGQERQQKQSEILLFIEVVRI